MRYVRFVCLFVLYYAACAMARNAPIPESQSSASISELDTVVVHGVQPGPGMWKISKDGHVLWVLGTLSPLPKNISWQSQEVEAVIAKSQEVLGLPGFTVRPKSFFGLLTMLPSLIGARKNPDGASLKETVAPVLYTRWSVLKARYIGRSDKVEMWRPIFAALELYNAAIEETGLSESEIVQNKVASAAKHADIKMTTPSVEFVLDDARKAIKEFKGETLEDLDCFGKTLDRIDTDLGTMTARANAWATGNLDALRKLPYSDQMTACLSALTEASFAHKRGIADIDARVEQNWLDHATAALSKNQVTFAMLPIRNLLNADGYISKLRKHGYAVDEPE